MTTRQAENLAGASLDADTLRHLLTDPEHVCRRLGLEVKKRQPGGVWIRCPDPTHDDRNPSCSVRRGPDGTLQIRCWSCGLAGDAYTLIGAVHSLDTRRDFVRIKEIAAELAHYTPLNPPPVRHEARRSPPRYPPQVEVADLWDRCGAPDEEPLIADYLKKRSLHGYELHDRDLARALQRRSLPSWAQPWHRSGHLLIAPAYDHRGDMRSLRAVRVIDSDRPKRLAPKGYAIRGLVLADALGRLILRFGAVERWPTDRPLQLIIVEGETDLWSWASRFSDADETAPAILGLIGPGSWTTAVASRVPNGAEVLIRTDLDGQGERYANEIRESLGGRCSIYRRVYQ